MKKSLITLLLPLSALALTSCSFGLDFLLSGLTPVTSENESGYFDPESYSRTSATPAKEGQTAMNYTYKDYVENNCYDLSSSPTMGETKLLVIPVWFNDSSNYISSIRKAYVREDIRRAYFGTENETGWHSVRSYYEKESMGRLVIDGTVSDWYECGKKSSTYYSEDSGANETQNLVKTAVNWYFSNHSDESRTDYDRDGDGYLDAVMLIYGAPDYGALGNSSASNMWAYCYWLQESSAQSKTNPGANVFFWASYDFMYGRTTALYKTGTSYASGDTSRCIVDAHTYVHEMGHVFGLDDYYDYGSNQYAPAGSFSMQDANRGGHDPYSVMSFGWADPYVLTESQQITINAFQKDHDVVLLSPSWNGDNSPFDEYVLVELFTPTGLNEFDCVSAYDGKIKGPSRTGVRVWHVDSRLTRCTGTDRYGDPTFSTSLITNPKDFRATDGVYLAMSNSYDNSDYGSVLGSSYYKYDILHLIRNSTSMTTRVTKDLSNSDLFFEGDSFSQSLYSKQFANGTKLDNGKALGWTFTVESISGSGDDATATISFTKTA